MKVRPSLLWSIKIYFYQLLEFFFFFLLFKMHPFFKTRPVIFSVAGPSRSYIKQGRVQKFGRKKFTKRTGCIIGSRCRVHSRVERRAPAIDRRAQAAVGWSETRAAHHPSVAAAGTLNRQTSAWVPATGHRCTFQLGARSERGRSEGAWETGQRAVRPAINIFVI